MCRLLPFLLTVNLVGCMALAVQPPVAPGGRYVCEDGKTFLVELMADGATAEVTYDNRKVALPETIGATDVRYSGGRTTLYLDGSRALLESGRLVFGWGCVQE